jgi:hypothetical protein
MQGRDAIAVLKKVRYARGPTEAYARQPTEAYARRVPHVTLERL